MASKAPATKDFFTREIAQESGLSIPEDRTVDLAFSSTAPYERYHYDEKSGRAFRVNEVLDHSPSAIDLSRLQGGAPLLRNHDTDKQIGAIVGGSVKIEGDRARAKVKLSRTQPGEDAFMDVNDGILRSVSVAYKVLKTKIEDSDKEVPTLKVLRWQPLEISLVAIPADATVGVGRSEEKQNMDEVEVTEKRAAEPKPPPADIEAQVTARAAKLVAEEVGRINKINALRDQFKDRVKDIHERAKAAIESKEPEPDFMRWVIGKIGTTVDSTSGSNAGNIGLSDKESSRFSILEAVRGITNGDRKVVDKYREMTDAVEKQTGLKRGDERSFFIPQDVMQRADPEMAQAIIDHKRQRNSRALVAETGGSGGYLVGTETLTGSMIELLRNASALSGLPTTNLTGLTGNIDIPKQSGGATAYWLHETADVTASDQAFQQIAFTPKRVTGATAFSRQLIAQTNLSVEAMVRSDLAQVIAISKDSKYLTGTGGSGQPLGLTLVSGIGSVTFTTIPTWAKIISFESTVETANVNITSGAYLITPACKGYWKALPVTSGVGRFLYENGMVNGYPAVSSNQVPATDRVIFGNWSDFIIADWAATEIIVDPYSLSLGNQIRIVMVSHTDCGVRYPASFVYSTDAGTLVV